MNDEEISAAWTSLEPAWLQRQRIDARVFEWIEAHNTPLAAEWFELFSGAPFSAAGLVAASAVAVLTAPPLLWFVRALV